MAVEEERIARARQRLAFSLRALKHRNFRLFTIGQTISLVGTWMQQVAVGWLVYRLTGSAVLLGLVGFVSQVPGFLIAPLAGVLADRLDKQRIVITTQLVMMVQAILLGVLVLNGQVTIAWVLVLMAVLGAATGFDIPARQSFLIEMVDREDLPNAIALNSSMFNGARLIGPAIAGFAIAALGEGWVILLNGVSYIAVLAGLFAMNLPRRRRASHQGDLLRNLRDGFRYAFEFVPIRIILSLVAIVSLAGVPFSVLMPVFATEVLNRGPRALGLLMAATGLGALAGALYLAARSTVVGLGRIVVFCATLFGTALVLFALSRHIWLSFLLLAIAGFGMMAQMAACNTVLQTIVDDDKRGRVMSFYTMAFTGTVPIGSLLIGFAADAVGAPLAIAAGGSICILAGLGFQQTLPALRRHVRPIYTRLGILPEVARGIQAATHQTTPEIDD